MNHDIENKRLQVFGRFAKDLATLSKCTERHVAAIIVDRDLTQVLSIGINGGPKGLADCLCTLGGKTSCVHAEINALTNDTSTIAGKILICTLSPCPTCAATIINAPYKFSAVYYLEAWKNDTGIKMLKQAGIKCLPLKLDN